MSAEPPDDYYAAVAEVVEAAKRFDEAQRLEREAGEAHMKLFHEAKVAERALGKAVDKLKGLSPRRAG